MSDHGDVAACARYGADTPVLKYGLRRATPLSEITVGDEVVGPDGSPRTVTAVRKGRGRLVKMRLKNRGGTDTSSLRPLHVGEMTPLSVLRPRAIQGVSQALQGVSLEGARASLAAALGTQIDPPVTTEGEENPTVEYDGSASFQVVMGKLLQYYFSVPRSSSAVTTLVNKIFGTSGLQPRAGAFYVEKRVKGKMVEKKFVYGNEKYCASEGVDPQYFTSKEEALQAAVVEARKSRKVGVSIFTLEQRLEELVARGYNLQAEIQVDSSLPGIRLRKRGNGLPSLRVVVQPSSDRSRGKKKGFTKAFSFRGPPTLDLPPDAAPMPYDLPVTADEQVFTTGHTLMVRDHLAMTEDEAPKWRLHRSQSVDYPEQPVPVDPMFLGLWLGDGSRYDTRVFNSREDPIMKFLARNAARLEMYLSWQHGIAFATIMRPGGALPPASDSMDIPLPPKRETYVSIYKRRVASGWTRTQSKDDAGRWIWLLPDGSEWCGTRTDELEDGLLDYGPAPAMNEEEMLAQEQAFYERVVTVVDVDADSIDAAPAARGEIDGEHSEDEGSEVESRKDKNYEAADETTSVPGEDGLADSLRRLHLDETAFGDLHPQEAETLTDAIITAEGEVEAASQEETEGFRERRPSRNRLLRIMQNLGIITPPDRKGPQNDTKRIPAVYLFNSRDVRLRLAAGLLDSDGTYNPITNSYSLVQADAWHGKLFADIHLLFRSLGFVTNVQSYVFEDRKYSCLYIGGENLHDIPCLLARKRAPVNARIKKGMRGFRFEGTPDVQESDWIELEITGDSKFVRDDLLVLCAGSGPVSPFLVLRSSPSKAQ